MLSLAEMMTPDNPLPIPTNDGRTVAVFLPNRSPATNGNPVTEWLRWTIQIDGQDHDGWDANTFDHDAVVKQAQEWLSRKFPAIARTK